MEPANVANRRDSASRGLRFLLIALSLYLGAHLLLRLLISPSVDVDESDIVLFTQSLEWGYHEQPPLYSWCVWLLARVFGTSVFTITLFRLAVLGAISFLLFRCTLRLTNDRNSSLLAAFAPFAVPTLYWNGIFYLTHTLLACALGVAVLHALLRLRDEGRTGDYLLLGLVVGLGGLTKYNFAIFAAGLLVAALTVPSFRACILDWRIVLSVIVALAVVAPHAVWLLRHWRAISDAMATKTAAVSDNSLTAMSRGAAALALNYLLILGPLAAFFFVCFPQTLRGSHRSEARRLLERFFIAVGLILIAQIVLTGTSRFHERWLQPLLVVAPAYFFSLLKPGELEPKHVRRFAAGLVVCAIGFLSVRAAQMWVGGLDRGMYPMQMAIAAPETELRAAGFDRATIVANDRELAGNLRLLFPRARVLCSAQSHYVPPPLVDGGPTFLVWNVRNGDHPPPQMQTFLKNSMPVLAEPGETIRVVELPPIQAGRKVNHIAVVRVAPRSAAAAMLSHR